MRVLYRHPETPGIRLNRRSQELLGNSKEVIFSSRI
jgi:hypothetical protein